MPFIIIAIAVLFVLPIFRLDVADPPDAVDQYHKTCKASQQGNTVFSYPKKSGWVPDRISICYDDEGNRFFVPGYPEDGDVNEFDLTQPYQH